METTKLDTTSLNNTEENIKTLKALFPTILTENNKIDTEKLKNIIGEYSIDDDIEKYQFTWPGKTKAFKTAQIPVNTTLKPYPEDSKNWDTTSNVYIEGDNLEVLKILQKSYLGKIKMIYIDPPYNTGKDFVYKDNFKDSYKNYLEQTGQVDDDGNSLETNKETNGRYHSNWLNMIYPRLIIAQRLLKDDGVIFISIDDNEVENLKKVCNEVFGEENFVAELVWKKRKTQANLTKYIASSHEYIIIFARNKENIKINKIPLREEYLKSMYKNPDNDPRGLWRTKPLASPNNAPNKEFELDLRNGRKIKAKWRVSQDTYDKWLKDNLIVIPNNGNGMPNAKLFLGSNEGQIPNSLLIDISTSEDGSKEIENLLGSNGVFTYPKPVNLIKYFLQLSTNSNKKEVELPSPLRGRAGVGGMNESITNNTDYLENKYHDENIENNGVDCDTPNPNPSPQGGREWSGVDSQGGKEQSGADSQGGREQSGADPQGRKEQSGVSLQGGKEQGGVSIQEGTESEQGYTHELPSPLRGRAGVGGMNENSNLTIKNDNYSEYTLFNAKELRKNQTKEEGILWAQLKSKRFDELKFRRQQPIGDYIVDFVCFDKKLIIELDGGQHNEEKNIEYDEKRTEFLNSLGYKVLRFWNNDVLRNLEGVMEMIYFEVNNDTPNPRPSPQGGRECSGADSQGRKEQSGVSLQVGKEQNGVSIQEGRESEQGYTHELPSPLRGRAGVGGTNETEASFDTENTEPDIILDFFSGSSTTAHAVMQLNAEDGGNRRFIMVQLPEVTAEDSEAFKAGYKNICEIGKERIRRAGDKIINNNTPNPNPSPQGGRECSGADSQGGRECSGADPQWGKEQSGVSIQGGKEQGGVSIQEGTESEQGYTHELPSPLRGRAGVGGMNNILDIGFKVFKLSSSNFKVFDPTKPVELFESSIVDGAKDVDLLYELMLKYGLEITTPVEVLDFDGCRVYNYNNLLFACFEKNLNVDFVKKLDKHLRSLEYFDKDIEDKTRAGLMLFLPDFCFLNDNDKINVMETLKDLGIGKLVVI